MPVKDIPPNASDSDNLMVDDHNNHRLNSYDSGPGKDLPNQFVASKKTDRSNCGVFLRHIYPDLEDNGIKNLCKRFGQVKEVRRFIRKENAIVMFATLADAENAIANINKLSFKVNGKVMKAEFQKLREKPSEETPPQQFETVETVNSFDLPLGTPSPLITDFDDEHEKIILETTGNESSRCATHSDAPESMAQMQTVGSFDEDTQQFVHNGTVNFTPPKQCKNCASPTLKFCKGCKDTFCSMYCLKEYNRNECGCSCVSSDLTKVNIKKLNRTAAGRGAKLLSPRVISPISRTVSLPDSDTKSIGSIRTLKQRLLLREKYENDQKYDAAIRIEPGDLPQNNQLVTLTNVVSHKYVFIRSYERKDNDQYLKYLNDVVEYAKIAPPLDELPKKGDLVLAEHDGYYHRAHVARIRNDEAIVAFLELGDVQIKPINGLKKISEELKNAKQFVFKVLLSGMETSLKSDTCLIYLYELQKKSTQLKFIAKDGGSVSGNVQCELIVSTTNESVTGKLKALNSIKTDQPVMQTDIPTKPFDVNVNEVIVIDNSLAVLGLVTVATVEHVSDMFQMHKRIQEYCKEDYKSPYMPRMNEICLAKFGDQWYRVKLERSYGDMNPVMFFIDFCLYNKVNIDNMRRMPSEFRYPQYSVIAEIGGITDETDAKKLSEKFPAMSKVSVAKVEYVNVDPEELKFFFITSDFAEGDVETGSNLRKSRRQQLERVMKRFTS